MRRRVLIPALIAALVVAWAASSSAETVQGREPRASPSTPTSRPHVLPRLRPAPVESTSTGGSPPPTAAIRRRCAGSKSSSTATAASTTKGLPVCSAPIAAVDQHRNRARPLRPRPGRPRQLPRRGQARRARSAAAGKILAFNSRRNGKPALLLHLFAGAPVRFTLVVPLTIGHLRRGRVRDRAAGEDPAARRRPRLGHRNRPDDRPPLLLRRQAPQLRLGGLRRSRRA